MDPGHQLRQSNLLNMPVDNIVVSFFPSHLLSAAGFTGTLMGHCLFSLEH